MPHFVINNFQFQYPFSAKQITLTGTITINHGDMVLISGASGGGKSTFLYALKGLIPRVITGTMQGEILFHGQSITAASNALKAKIALLQQNPDFQIINRLVLDELAFGLENLAYTREDILAKIAEYALRFNIEPLLSREVSSLSGGEKQKIALVSLLLTEPEVLLLDEPTAFLDPESAQLFMQYLHELRGKITIVVIEHNLQYLDALYPLTQHLVIDGAGVIHQAPSSALHINKEFTNLPLNFSNLTVTGNTHNNLSTTNNPVILEVRNLCYQYKLHNTALLHNINFRLHHGETLGVIGKSGSGKSTLLKLLAGIIKAKNMVYFEGVDIATIPYKKFYAQVGLLFQNPENHFLYDDVAKELNGSQDLLNLLSLTNNKEQNPFTLSEGQKRRLSLGILSLAKSRKVLLLDEPTFGQDVANKQIIINLILSLRSQGIAFIIVSHDYAFIQAVCDRVYKLYF